MSNMPLSETSVLIAEITGESALVNKLGAVEAKRAVERCLTRAIRSVESNQGTPLHSQGRRLVAYFQRCENAVLAANEIRERISQLPPVSGVSLAVKIGVHSGYFDTAPDQHLDSALSFAGHVVSVAAPGQVLLSAEAAGQLPDAMRQQMGTQTQLSFQSNDAETPYFELRGDVNNLRISSFHGPFLDASLGEPEISFAHPVEVSVPEVPKAPRLMLRYFGTSYIVNEAQPALIAGRDEGSDVVINDRRASRQHARIEWRQGRYILIDTSTNGTFLLGDSGVEIVLRRKECDLPLRGRIGFGYSPQEIGVECALFDLGSTR